MLGNMLENVLIYEKYDLNFPNYKNEKKENDDSNDLNDQKVVRMKLYNFDNGYLECLYFRADSDNVLFTLN